MIKSIIYCILAGTPVISSIIKGAYKSKLLAPFVLFIVYSLVHQILMVILSKNGIRNVWLINLWLLIQFSFLSLFYIQLFNLKNKMKWFFTSVSIVLTLFLFGIKTLNFDNIPLQLFVHYSIGITAAIFLIKIMIYAKKNPIHLPMFWICGGLAVFFLGSNLIFSITSLFDVAKHKWLIDIYGIIVFVLIALSNTFYSIGLLCSSKNTTSSFS